MQHSDAEHDIFTAWIRGWALTREVAPPIAHADGFRIDVGLPRQAARYVFPHPCAALRELGGAVTQPWVFLKACATSDELHARLPARWQPEPDGFMMTCDDAPFPGSGALPPGYALHVDDGGTATRRAHVRVLADDGAVAAEGHLALDTRLAIYDRIGTDPAHRRRGLGVAVMHALQSLARAHGRHAGVLVATPMGRTLYESLGWRVHAPWATAVIPGADAAPGASARFIAGARCRPAP
jgi:GNAT superfamily N-acetyltransferase